MELYYWLIGGFFCIWLVVFIAVGVTRQQKIIKDMNLGEMPNTVNSYFEQVAKILSKVDEEMIVWSEKTAKNA